VAKSNFIEGDIREDESRSSCSLGGGCADDLAKLSHLLLLVVVRKLVEDLVAGLGLHVAEVLEAFAPDATC